MARALAQGHAGARRAAAPTQGVGRDGCGYSQAVEGVDCTDEVSVQQQLPEITVLICAFCINFTAVFG